MQSKAQSQKEFKSRLEKFESEKNKGVAEMKSKLQKSKHEMEQARISLLQQNNQRKLKIELE